MKKGSWLGIKKKTWVAPGERGKNGVIGSTQNKKRKNTN